MASRSIEFRLSESERELASFKDSANHLQSVAARLEQKIDAIRRALRLETNDGRATEPSAAKPPPLPPQSQAPKPGRPLAPEIKPKPPVADPVEAHSDPQPPTSVQPPPPIPSSSQEDDSPREPQGIELEFGRVWFVRIGIGLLLTGFVFLSTYAYQNYIINWSAGSRVAVLYVAALLITGTGVILERWKESLRNYGRVVAAGGWAAIYYTTYAAHHLERLRVIESPVAAAILLSLVALAFFAYAASKKSSALAVGSLLLAFYATAINPMGWLGCFSGLLLGIIGMVFFLRYRWMQTGITSLLGVYLSYLYWHGFINSTAVSEPTRWFLVGYWLLFTASILAPQAKHYHRTLRVAFASVNNLVFFVLFSFQFHDGTWVSTLSTNALAFGGVLLALSLILGRLRDSLPILRDLFLIKGLSLVTWGLTLELTGHQLFLTLLIESVALAFIWRRSHSQILRGFVWISASLSAILALGSLGSTVDQAPNLSYLILGALFVVLAYLTRGAPHLDEDENFSLESAIASLLALLIPTAALSIPYDAPETGLVMMGIGLVLWLGFLIRPDRWPIPELVWLGQIYAVLGALVALSSTDILWHYGLIAGACAIAFQTHGLSYDRKRPEGTREASRLFEFAFTALAFLALALWIHRGLDSASLTLLVVTAIPLAGHLYGSFFSRAAVTIASQLFYLSTLLFTITAASQNEFLEVPSQLSAFFAFLIVAAHLVVVHLVPKLNFREFIKETHLVAAALLWSIWCIGFLDGWWFTLAWSGCALYFLPKRFQAHAHAFITLAILALSLGGVCLLESGDFWLRYLALPATFIAHLIHTRNPLDDSDQDRDIASFWSALALFLVISLTTILSQHTLDAFDGKGLAICWALLGLALFGLGLGVRIRLYRLSGLALLALSLVHVLAVDVWKLDTVLRILSFLTLGLVLLALGFIYNRWHEALRKLL